MLINDIFSTAHRTALIEFQSARGRALIIFLRSWLFVRNTRLDNFNDLRPSLLPGHQYRGYREIPLVKIIGSVERGADFNRNFRPLKFHLHDRWVNIYLLSRSSKCLPIRVNQVGEQYFVIDGHHRTSVARALGMSSIHAEVWEYQPKRA